MSYFYKYIVFLSTFILSGIASSQAQFNSQFSDVDDQELLKKAEDYVRKEDERRDEAFHISHDVLKRTKILDNKIKGNKVLALFHYYKYAIDSALFYANRGVKLIDTKEDALSLETLSVLYLTLSNASRDKNLIADSKKWALKGIETAEKLGDYEILDDLLSNLAITHRLMGNVDKALEVYMSALKYKENPERYSSIALCYLDLKNYTQALFFHKKALEYYDTASTNSNRGKAVTLMNIGAVYLEMYKDDEALTYFNESLKIAKAYDYPLIILNNMINIGEVFTGKKELSKAKKNYNEVLGIAQNSGFLKQQWYVYHKLKDIALLENNYRKALEFTEKKNQLQDSISNLQKNKEIAQLEVQYETLKKEKEISVLKKDQELRSLEIKKQQSQKEIILYAFMIILVPLIGLLFMYYQKLKGQSLLHKREREIGEQKIEALIRNQELKLIKTSINVQDQERKRIAQELHDRIGGNLAAIKLQFGTVKEDLNNLDLIYNQLDDTYEQVRVLSHDLVPDKFSHSNFTKLLKEYMENIGNASDLTIDISTYQEGEINGIDAFFHNELFSVFQELITNTIKHADASKVDIQIDAVQNNLRVVYEDNGKGFDQGKVSAGIGLNNIEGRVQKLYGATHIDSKLGRGTIVSIEIPLKP
ncbi:tetratricopeptide repeat protein [Aquimarina sp. D1M17]|uniref:ATP-binding protein n=1 Tax=Aquimarina acroporae TaxID=2937283 RepID=UPI0020BDC65B|nr:tetratricopeptide repeat-containing sensor histidine kinase [Aquimarina acroporae]MCK8523517.1 tetratricopeptide repeat protein [Aquimarina acroporae]